MRTETHYLKLRAPITYEVNQGQETVDSMDMNRNKVLVYPRASELDDRSIRLVTTWEKRAQVKKRFTYTTGFVPERPDFPTELLPFDYAEWERKHGEETMSIILTYAWLGFNHKVINVESNLLVPSCKLLMDRAFEQDDGIEVELLAQAQTDEAFHVLMAHKVNCISLARRGLSKPAIPRPRIVNEIGNIVENEARRTERELSIIAASIVTEVLIKGFLSPISHSKTIQPLHRIVTNMHLIDEAGHGQVFRVVAHRLLMRLSGEQRDYFIARMRECVDYFSDVDADVWLSLIGQAGLQVTQEMAEEIESHQAASDYSELDTLLRENERISVH
ncbi:MAG: diiron oxygenase [Acidihalobacter sp.]